MKTKTKNYNQVRPHVCTMFILALTALTGFSGCSPDYVASNPIENPMETSDALVPLPFFVRCDNGAPIDPATTPPGALLLTDLGRQPIMAPDGTQVTWGEWIRVKGNIVVECIDEGTKVTLSLRGLIPNGVYTIWNVTFKEPGFTGEFDGPGLPSHVKAFGPLGLADGSQSGFTASAGGEADITAITPPGALGTVGEIGACALTDEMEWHVVGLYHSDGQTHGSVRGPDGTHAEQLAFIFKNTE